MKKSDLHREWARVLDMCEVTGVDPNTCWNVIGYDRLNPARRLPEFNCNPNNYEFAVAIIEGKPVFLGDKLYSKHSGRMIEVTNRHIDINKYSFNPPKKTFMLNGEKLPCPDVNVGVVRLDIHGKAFWFKSVENRNKVKQAIHKLLNDAYYG